MEGAGALELWKLSMEKNKLVYSTYIGDGDSSSFKNLLKADPYNGVEIVRKEECLGKREDGDNLPHVRSPPNRPVSGGRNLLLLLPTSPRNLGQKHWILTVARSQTPLVKSVAP